MITEGAYQPIERTIPSEQSIVAFFHCKICLDEWGNDKTINSLREYTNYEVGWTKLGLQVWCKRHEANVCHIDLQNLNLPANTGRTP